MSLEPKARSNRNPEPRCDGRSYRGAVEGRVLPYHTGVLPGDFPEGIPRLREANGLTWSAFAHALGVVRKEVRRQRGASRWVPGNSTSRTDPTTDNQREGGALADSAAGSRYERSKQKG